MEKLILGIICTVVSPIIMFRSYREMRKNNANYREKRKHTSKKDYFDGPTKGQLILATVGFFMGIFLLVEYFSSG